jgi:hypothetical protein
MQMKKSRAKNSPAVKIKTNLVYQQEANSTPTAVVPINQAAIM